MRPAIPLAVLFVVAAPAAACATGEPAAPERPAPAAGAAAAAKPAEPAAPAGVDAGADGERTIAGRRFVRRGEDWYLEADGRSFRVLPRSLSLQFRDGTTEDERRDFLARRAFEVVRSNRLGILDVRTGPDRHAVDWLAELTGDAALALVDVHTEGVYEEERPPGDRSSLPR